MKICRFDDDRLGLVQDDEVLDVSKALEAIPEQRWPLVQGDPLILHFKAVLAAAKKLAPKAKRKALAKVKLLSPVANPGKIIAAPINYNDHIAESVKDPGIAHGRTNIQKASASGACSSRRPPRSSASARRSACAGPSGATTTRSSWRSSSASRATRSPARRRSSMSAATRSAST